MQGFIILDGYVDEPSCLGVPPYISPYPRYIAGALIDAGAEWRYITIDQYRNGISIPAFQTMVIICGGIVPGKYLRGMPASPHEVEKIVSSFPGRCYIAGPGGRFWKRRISDAEVIVNDADAFLYDLVRTGAGNDRRRTLNEWERWAELGACVIRDHPDFPEPLIAEIEMMRSCVRYFMGGCSFCTDVLYGEPVFRGEASVVREVQRMRALGLERFRLGGISCTFTYRAKGIGETETPKPNPDAWRRILTGVCTPDQPKVLHTDNANPAVMSAHPAEATRILKMLIEYCTPGNILSLGMESADEAVIRANRLNATPEDVMRSIRMINRVGQCIGKNGMPYLLPGLNFLTGLDGESRETFRKNLEFLRRVMDEGLLLRRINIREVAPWRKVFRPGFRVEARRFRETVRKEIDHQMIKKVVPAGRVLHDVYLECIIGNVTFGRQIGTYPILIGIPGKLAINRFITVVVTSHGERSITGLEYPIRVNTLPLSSLSEIPGLGRKGAATLVRRRPFKSLDQMLTILKGMESAEPAYTILSTGSTLD